MLGFHRLLWYLSQSRIQFIGTKFSKKYKCFYCTAISQGDLDRLLVPSDSYGRRCGVDSEVVKKPYLLFFNIEKCISPLVPINGCPTPQVCVEECPTKSFFFIRDKCTNLNLNEIINDLICIRGFNKQEIKTCDDVNTSVNSEHCARWYLPSDSRKFTKLS